MKKLFLLFLLFAFVLAIVFYFIPSSESPADDPEWDIKKIYTSDSLIVSYAKFNLKGCKSTNFKFVNYNYKDTNYYLNPIKELIITPSLKQNFESTIELPGIKIGTTKNGKFIPVYRGGDLFLKVCYYTQFIDSLEISLLFSCNNKRVEVKKLFHTKELTYQRINYWQLPGINFDFRTNDTATYIKSIHFKGIKLNNSAKLIIGDLSIIHRKTTEINAKDWKEFILPTYSNVLVGKTYMFSKFSEQYIDVLCPPDTTNAKKEVIYVSSFITKILKNYTHYSIKHIERDSILREHQRLISNSASLDDYYPNLNTLLLKLEDPHIRINYSPEDNKNVQPIYFKDILGELEVVAIFDTSIKKIKTGCILKKINDEDPLALLRDFSKNMYGSNYSVRRQKALNNYMNCVSKKYPNDGKIRIVFSDKGKVDTAFVDPKKWNTANFVTPENFKRSNSYAYNKTDHISYLKVGTLRDESAVPYFLTYKDSLLNSNGIILDLRDNPGSDNCIHFILSLFLDQPCPFIQNSIEDYFYPLSKEVNYETSIIKPSINTIDKPIAILINTRTTCGAEMLIWGLKNYYKNRVVTIGTESTAGAAQYGNLIILPSSKKFKRVELTYYNYITYVCGNDIDEIKGIAPDVKTSYYSYKDLAPYEDKLKRTGFDFIKALQKSNLKRLGF